MTLQRVRRQLEERRRSLIDTLQKSKETMELSKQHQLYGAIKELENVLKTIDYHYEEHLKGTDFELLRAPVTPLRTRKTAFRTLGQTTKSIFLTTKTAFREKVVKRTANVGRRMTHRIRIYKEALKEAKARSKEKEEKGELIEK